MLILEKLNSCPASKQGEIVNLNFKGVNQSRNEAILNTIMQVLAEDQVNDKRKISEVSIDFIDERLKGLTKSIDTISQNTIAYQMASGIFDPAAQTGNALTSIIKGQEEAFSYWHTARNCKRASRKITIASRLSLYYPQMWS